MDATKQAMLSSAEGEGGLYVVAPMVISPMAATCPACNWTGSATAVRDGGRCPDCGEPIRYDRKPLQSAPRLTLYDFLPRAAKVLRSIGADENDDVVAQARSEAHTSELQALMRNAYAVF